METWYGLKITISMSMDVNGEMSIDIGCVLGNAAMYKKIARSLIYMKITKPNSSYTIGIES